MLPIEIILNDGEFAVFCPNMLGAISIPKLSYSMQVRSSLPFGLGICLGTRHEPTLTEENCTALCSCGIPGSSTKLVTDRRILEPLSQLLRDHEAVLQECALLVMITKEMDPNADEKLEKKAISCVHRLGSLLTNHQSREEEILIPILKERFDSEVSASVGKEHSQIMELLQRLEEKVAPPHTLNSHTDKSMPNLVTQFDSFVRSHFAREENVLFWFASLYIPPSDQKIRN